MGKSLRSGAVLGVDDIYKRLDAFKSSMMPCGWQSLPQLSSVPFYFAKVDVKCCFDSIHQENLLKILEQDILNRVLADLC